LRITFLFFVGRIHQKMEVANEDSTNKDPHD